ncbi:hypothetical protein BOTBODRAFT_174968 [Botryobasidium botryosum FD-172 SS1]|uniref:Nucleoside transporter n=1 Tax=Botryobasidium botryosum (strain FD-172 SS1) TaxID=930990 RepID=A0A067MHG9_BOTB1|nr:hypothetical protein BOTBODRAFT_174968 [Botryobasidium botryosum FD-172 SS1]
MTPSSGTYVATISSRDGRSIDSDDEDASPSRATQALDPKVRWIQCALGASALLPWNALITALPYFLSRLESTPNLLATFGSYLVIAFTSAQLAFFAYATTRTNTANFIAWARYTTTALVLLLLLTALLPVLPLPPQAFATLVLAGSVVQAATGAYRQTALVALAAHFGPFSIQAYVAGQAAVGVAVSVVQYVGAALAMYHDKGDDGKDGGGAEIGAMAFFALATAFMASMIPAHAWLTNSPAYRALSTSRASEDRITAAQGAQETQPLLPAASVAPEEHKDVSMWEVARMNWKYNLGVGLVFSISLSVFPSITTSIRSVRDTDSGFFSPLLFNYFHFVIFNTADYLGRHACSNPRFHIWSPNKLLGLSVVRVLFIPLILLCNVQRPGQQSATPIFNSDVAYWLLLAALALSNGYVSSLCMMAAPSLEHNPRLSKSQVDAAATISQFCLIGGLSAGSVLSMLVGAIADAVLTKNSFRG